MAVAPSKQWTRVRTLGRGASGAEVFLAADDVSGELFAVKSACASGATALRREQSIMAGLQSPLVVSCIGGLAGLDASYHLFLEFAPGGSLADEVARTGGLAEPTVRAYAADVAAGLAYLHGLGTVHGDVKARNVVIGADGRAKLTDFGCARKSAGGGPIIGGTPSFMAPEVARGEEQGPAADVWALGCTVLEMATGRAPWSGMGGDTLAAMHRIGYTDALPEVPQWLSDEAKDFLGMCLARQATDRCTAAQLLEHPFLAVDAKLKDVRSKWVSPKSTLGAAFWESESDTEDNELTLHGSAERVQALACAGLPDWDSDEGWIDVLSAPVEAASVPVKETTELDEETSGEDSDLVDIAVDCNSCTSVLSVGDANDDSVWPHNWHQSLETLVCRQVLPCKLQFCNRIMNAIAFVLAAHHKHSASSSSRSSVSRLALLLIPIATRRSFHCRRGHARAIKVSESQTWTFSTSKSGVVQPRWRSIQQRETSIIRSLQTSDPLAVVRVSRIIRHASVSKDR